MNETKAWVAGDELDAVVDRVLYGPPEQRPGGRGPHRYSRNPRAAIYVIEGLTQRLGERSKVTVTITVEPYDPAHRYWYWRCDIADREGYDGEATAESMPMAVCLAFLNLHEAGD